ncbi:rCG47316, isoform CRA_a [Rattus norvegicus]|uniref:RCG47316, isoform CRA_a n=1 Tax=Rattus norvegicus TaxID=10116 RepID=A6HZS7_RAT|nr:rCG47316, isoform CRA_a [Rattus norvegicus]
MQVFLVVIILKEEVVPARHPSPAFEGSVSSAVTWCFRDMVTGRAQRSHARKTKSTSS